MEFLQMLVGLNMNEHGRGQHNDSEGGKAKAI